MHVVGKLTVAQIDSDRVSGDCFERNWHSRVERLVVSGDIVGKTVYCRDHAAVRDGKDGLSISIIRLLSRGSPENETPSLICFKSMAYRLEITGRPSTIRIPRR